MKCKFCLANFDNTGALNRHIAWHTKRVGDQKRVSNDAAKGKVAKRSKIVKGGRKKLMKKKENKGVMKFGYFHESKRTFECCFCYAPFTLFNNLKRHNKEQHVPNKLLKRNRGFKLKLIVMARRKLRYHLEEVGLRKAAFRRKRELKKTQKKQGEDASDSSKNVTIELVPIEYQQFDGQQPCCSKSLTSKCVLFVFYQSTIKH